MQLGRERRQGFDKKRELVRRWLAQPLAPRRRCDRAQKPVTRAFDAVERAPRHSDRRLATRAFDVGCEPPQTGARDPPAEPARGGFLETMALVKDDGVVFGKNTSTGSDVSEVEGVIGDHEL